MELLPILRKAYKDKRGGVMRIEIYLEANEMGTPLEFANELIRMETNDRSPCGFEQGVSWLAEMAEYITVFVKHNKISEVE